MRPPRLNNAKLTPRRSGQGHLDITGEQSEEQEQSSLEPTGLARDSRRMSGPILGKLGGTAARVVPA